MSVGGRGDNSDEDIVDHKGDDSGDESDHNTDDDSGEDIVDDSGDGSGGGDSRNVSDDGNGDNVFRVVGIGKTPI